jgi:hypothetical protein
MGGSTTPAASCGRRPAHRPPPPSPNRPRRTHPLIDGHTTLPRAFDERQHLDRWPHPPSNRPAAPNRSSPAAILPGHSPRADPHNESRPDDWKSPTCTCVRTSIFSSWALYSGEVNRAHGGVGRPGPLPILEGLGRGDEGQVQPCLRARVNLNESASFIYRPVCAKRLTVSEERQVAHTSPAREA